VGASVFIPTTPYYILKKLIDTYTLEGGSVGGDIEDVITKWLLDEGFEVKRITAGLPIESSWGLDVRTPPPSRIGFRVFKPKAKPDRTILTLGVAIAKEHLSVLNKMRREDRFRFISRLVLELLKVCNTCNILVEPSPIDPRGITITLILIDDYIRKSGRQEFLNSVYKLLNTYVAIISYFNEAFPHIPTSRLRSEDTVKIM